jgi:formyltetrahydrofolate deformylase
MTLTAADDSAPRHILTLKCPDAPGIVHTVSGALLEVGGNILENAQFREPETNTFCLRTDFVSDVADAESIRKVIGERLVDERGIDLSLAELAVHPIGDRPRIMVLVSKFDHCLVDLLYRWRNGGLPVDIPVIASNHLDCAEVAERYGIPFVHLPITKETKPEQETQIKALIDEHDVDLVVLARYMQILSDDMCRYLDGRAINIHHSFLPGFKGAKPYHQAHARGVKLVGATHFVTADLDEGPIVEQDVARVGHEKTAAQLVELGQDTERLVLSRAVRHWAEHRVFMVGDKTVVFA